MLSRYGTDMDINDLKYAHDEVPPREITLQEFVRKTLDEFEDTITEIWTRRS